MAASSSKSPSSAGILAAVAEGRADAMEDCIRQYGGLVWTITKRYVSNQQAAEDVVQEIFTDLWKSAPRYDSRKATESTFIGILARRRSIDWLRKLSRQPTLEPLPEAEDMPQESKEPSASRRCEGNDIRGALSQLPEETQRLFALHFDKGLSHPEISRETSLPLGTVKTKLRRGLIEVRNILSRLDSGSLSTLPNS